MQKIVTNVWILVLNSISIAPLMSILYNYSNNSIIFIIKV